MKKTILVGLGIALIATICWVLLRWQDAPPNAMSERVNVRLGPELSHTPRTSIRKIYPSPDYLCETELFINGESQAGYDSIPELLRFIGRNPVAFVYQYAPLPTDAYRIQLDGIPEGADKKEAVWLLLKQVIEDTFSLQITCDNREVDIYALALSGPGKKLSDACTLSGDQEAVWFSAPQKEGQLYKNTSMNDLAVSITLNAWLDRVVVDRTGIKELYDFVLPIRRHSPRSVKDALADIGLQLLDDREQLDVMVVEHVAEKGGPQ